jgi:cell division protein FtsI/penicillin-binding protein 2
METGAHRRFLWVKRRVTEDEARSVRDLKWPADWVGFRFEQRRCYPCGALASHVLGVRDIDGNARDGIEKLFDPVLRGKTGFQITARDARGKIMAIYDDLSRRAQPGSSVVLTIDTVIQTYVEEVLDAVMADWSPTSATAIVMNPRTGEVLALANRPTFDPENPGSATSEAWVNRAVSDSYEPGSTFKPFIVAAAIDWELVVPEELIDCHQGVYRMGPRVLHSHHRHGELSVTDIIVKSDNIGMAIIGERMTNPGLLHAVQSFGFGRVTGIELPGEASGHVRPLRQWTPFYSTGSVPMGHELAVTPIQLITAFCTIANGGERLRPRIVRAIVSPDGSGAQVFNHAETAGRAIRAETARQMIDPILTGVVDRGTGRRSQLPGYAVFGKTGTAQKQLNRRGYARGRHVSSFVAGAPASDPAVVAILVVNDPSKGKEHYGGEVAAPPVREILRRTLAYLDIPPDRESAPRAASTERITD